MSKEKNFPEYVEETLKKFNQAEYIKDFQKKTYKRYQLVFNKNTEKDIITKLESVPNKNAYITDLIKKDLEK